MKKPLFAGLLSIALHAHAAVLPNEAAQPLMSEGNLAVVKGQYQLALEKYSLAMKADPAASLPLASIAHVLYLAAEQASGEQADNLRRQAEGAARQALRLGADDPIAQEVLRQLDDRQPPPLHKASPEAWKLMQEAEILYQSSQYDQARAKYEAAAQADPQYSPAWVYAGDCFYSQKNYAEAEQRFRKATEVEPLNGQAWRFLSDALAWQGKFAAADEVLVKAIAAQPSQRPSWNKLANLRARAGTPLTALKLEPKAFSVFDNATGKFKLNVNPDASDKGSADLAVWMSLALSDASYRTELREGKTTQSPFAADLLAWKLALKVADQSAENGAQLKEAGLQTMQMLARADQLEAALLILRFKESYRHELEVWKKEHPHGVQTFIASYGLAP